MRIYEFAPGSEDNSYIFPTDFGWLYTVLFRNSAGYFNGSEILFNNALVFELVFTRSIYKADAIKEGADHVVKETLHSILRHHLEGHGHIPLYFFICYATDKKEAARMNLFIKWYESFDTADWQLYSYELTDGNTTIYYGLIVNSNHPFFSVIPEEFENFVQIEKKAWKELFRRR